MDKNLFGTVKYPVGIQDFDEIVQDGYLYVDKTALIYRLVKTGKIYFLSRPRRFGKSLLVSTLEHYFRGHKELFKGLAIEQWEEDWLEYPVFHLDFNSANYSEPDALRRKLDYYLGEWEHKYGLAKEDLNSGDRFVRILAAAHENTGRRCVVLIDEYDKPMLDVMDTGLMTMVGANKVTLESAHRDVLAGFYSAFKEAGQDLQFVLLTGVTKFSQVSVFSGFNQPKDISMDARYEALCGITQEELEQYFAGPIREFADVQGVSADALKAMLKAQYDGYHFSSKLTDIYNPFSLLNAFDSKDLSDYWFQSGTPTYLMRLMAHSEANLDEMTGKYYSASEFVEYKADAQKPLPMIYQSGYLTIKEYDSVDRVYLLDFPNDEVRTGFVSLVASNYFKTRNNGVESAVLDCRRSVRNGETAKLRAVLTSFFSSIPYDVGKVGGKLTERDFQYSLYLLFKLIGAGDVKAEHRSSQGRADCIVETRDYVYIFEFKLDGDPAQALAQIDERGYAQPYATDSRKLVKIGVNFSSASGTIEGWEEA